MTPLFRSMAVLVESPWLAAMPAAVFLWLFVASRKIFVLITAAAWLVYLPYEYAMKLRLLCTGECNIRIDLLLLYPVLAGLSALGLLVSARALARGQG